MSESPLPPDSPENEPPVASTPVVESAKPESRLRHFFRTLLRWVVLALVLFAAGVAVIYFTRVQPLQTQNNQVTATQAALQKEVNQQQSDMKQLRSDNAILTSANSDLNAMLIRDKAHLDLLRALNNTTTARMYLAQNNPTEARKALGLAKDELNSVSSAIKDPAAVKPILDRLDLVLSEMDSSPQTAASDLGIMNDSLLTLEQQQFPSS